MTTTTNQHGRPDQRPRADGSQPLVRAVNVMKSVSYTHLTLPTNREV